MEINQVQVPSNQNSVGLQAQPQKVNPNNSRLFVSIISSVLLTATITGLVVYFWQNSANEKAISSLEQTISSLEEQISTMKKARTTSPSTLPPELSPTPTTKLPVNLRTYSNKKYGFSFSYPQDWKINDSQDPDTPLSLSNIADGHTITIQVWRATGFGYCYKYGERKEIFVGGKTAQTADGIGPSEVCDKPEEFSNRGNTFVLIPLEDKPEGLPANQIHISYDYPLDYISVAKSNLDQVLSTFKFTD